MVKVGDKIVVWFSCGAASAVALKRTVEKYGSICEVIAMNNPVAEEDEDNRRFLRDVEEWVGIKIKVVGNPAFPDNSAVSVWEKRKAMSFPHGAPCTEELKKSTRLAFELFNHADWYVFGFTTGEEHRDARRRAEHEILPVLIDEGLSKDDCFKILRDAGIKLPRVYTEASRFGTGYPNANCIGCVKATSPTYWNHVRETRPEVFKQRSDQSRELGVKLCRCHPEYLPFCSKHKDGEWHDDRTGLSLHVTDKNGRRKLESPRIFLDELPPDARGRDMKTMKIDCGILCEVAE